MTDNICITGMGIASPIGCDESTFWESLTTGKTAAAPVDTFDTCELNRHVACQVRENLNLDASCGRASGLALYAAGQALRSASIDTDSVPGGRFAVLVGTTMGETEFIESRLGAPDDKWLTEDHKRQIALGKPGAISTAVQTELNVSGPSYDLYGACAAGNMAIATARRKLLAGECDVALAGGADGFSQLAFIGFMRLRVMAAEVCRPFDKARDGLFVGEGAALFVLERESSAIARGAPIRARILGTGITSESYHPTRPDPNGDGLQRATVQALHDAGLRDTDIDYICAHGTGTPQNDAIEVRVMDQCFPRGVAFSSIKSLTGHTMGAAAAIEAACCVLSLEHQTVIPTWFLQDVLEPCPLDALRDAPRACKLRHVVNNSAGFGGYNSSLVLAAA